MSISKPRPIDTLQNIVSSFKTFERKLDKLQDDVNYHGHTLSELHVMIANITGGANLLNNEKLEDVKKLVNKTTAMHQESNFYHEKPIKTKRRSSIQPLQSKFGSKGLQSQRFGNKISKDIGHPHVAKSPSSPKNALSRKRSSRQRKSDAPRKATSLRSKMEDKKQAIGLQIKQEIQSY